MAKSVYVQTVACTYHLEKCKICKEDVVKINFWVDPCVVEMQQCEANGLVGNLSRVNQLAFSVHTACETTTEQIDAHDAEY